MIPVVLSGGSGTRLWPVSRAQYPKQFCEFYDQSFLKNSLTRVMSFDEPYIVTVESMKSLTIKTLNDLQLPSDHALYEPIGKNTAPAVGLICRFLQMKKQEDEVVGIFPADHLILDDKGFVEAVKLASDIAQKGQVVTLGITPRYPATGYGYIETTSQVVASSGKLKGLTVKGFREKPDHATAEKFMTSGLHYWNAGMFVFQVRHMIGLFEKFLPEMWKKFAQVKDDFSNLKYMYANMDSISLDYGIMERLQEQVCIPCDVGWSDVGSWDELARLAEEVPALRSDSRAHVFVEDAQKNYVYAIRNKVVGLIGVDNLIVVDTPDALLVARQGESQKVKELVQQIKHAGLPEASEHPFEVRPWGGYEILSDAKDFKVKTVTVDPGAALSYQSHSKRHEHWVIVKGKAEVILDEKSHPLKVGDFIHVPVGAKHRIRNTGAEPLIFVEVQTGSYFGEDDIVRYQDDYNRE